MIRMKKTTYAIIIMLIFAMIAMIGSFVYLALHYAG